MDSFGDNSEDQTNIVFNEFRRLPPNDQSDFLNLLGLYLDIHLPDFDSLMISKAEYRRLQRGQTWVEALYAIARQITIEAGMPWTDPRTGQTHKP
jgi:hypothetical protein